MLTNIRQWSSRCSKSAATDWATDWAATWAVLGEDGIGGVKGQGEDRQLGAQVVVVRELGEAVQVGGHEFYLECLRGMRCLCRDVNFHGASWGQNRCTSLPHGILLKTTRDCGHDLFVNRPHLP